MNDELVRRVKSNLRAQCYTMNDLWLQGCIEYILTQEPNASDATISTFVTAQWILSDLHDITDGVGSLPPNLSRQNKVLLPKKYILQMMKMYDVSQSKYHQLEKIRKVNTSNVEATTIKAESWEPKGKRMIQLFLTDGVQDVIAIEYKPIRKLKDTLLPGFKLKIIGPVTCRKGVILLEEKNYEEVGGEVESLLITNALENVLARAINLEENPNPYGDETETHPPPTEFPDDDFEINFDELNQIEQLSLEEAGECQSSENTAAVTRVQNSTSSTTSTSRVRSVESKSKATNDNKKKSGNVERSQSNKNRTVVRHVENSASSMTCNTRVRSEESKKKTTNDKNKKTSRGIKSYFQQTKCEDVLSDNFDDILGAIDVDELQVPETISSNPKCTSKSYRIAPSTRSVISSQKNETNSLMERQRNNKNSDTAQLKALVTRPQKSEPSDDDDVIIVEDYEPEISQKVDSKKNCKGQSINAIKFEDDDILIDDFDMAFDDPIQETKSRIFTKNKHDVDGPSSTSDNNPANSTRINVPEPKRMREATKPENRLSLATKLRIESQDQKVQSPACSKRPAEDVLSPPSSCSPKVICLDKTAQSNLSNRKITEFTKKLVPKEEPPPKICNFICEVLQQRGSDSTTYETIRGKLSKLKSLTPKDSHWYLEATLTDDTASIDVVFSSQVLEDLIGFSVTEFRQKKKLRKTHPEINEFLRKSLRMAEAKIQRMDALVELELKGQGVPTVVKMTQLTEEQRRLIEKRISILTP